MNIVDTLNKFNISKSRFAFDFALSRPTLDDYILKFESKLPLPKEKYNIIFKALFEEDLDSEAFFKRYKQYRLLINRDRVLNISDLDPNTTDDVLFVVTEIKKDAQTSDKLLLKFLTNLIVNYKKGDEIARNIVLYTAFLNGSYVQEIDDKQKRYLGNFYKLNRNFLDDVDSLDIKEFEELKKRRKQLLISNELKTEEIEKKINAVLHQYVEQAIAEDPSTDDIDEIVSKVISKFKG